NELLVAVSDEQLVLPRHRQIGSRMLTAAVRDVETQDPAVSSVETVVEAPVERFGNRAELRRPLAVRCAGRMRFDTDPGSRRRAIEPIERRADEIVPSNGRPDDRIRRGDFADEPLESCRI